MAAAVPAGPPPTTNTSVSANTGIFARRLGDRLIGTRAPPRAAFAELLDALRAADAARIIAAARRLAENLALPRLAS